METGNDDARAQARRTGDSERQPTGSAADSGRRPCGGWNRRAISSPPDRRIPIRVWQRTYFEGRCLLFDGAHNNGYPVASIGGKRVYLTRRMLGLGERDGRQANHEPHCRHPKRCLLHVYMGSQFDNVADAVAAGLFHRRRSARGMEHGNVRHSFGLVLEARRLHRRGMSYAEVGRCLNVDRGTVRGWCRRKTRATA